MGCRCEVPPEDRRLRFNFSGSVLPLHVGGPEYRLGCQTKVPDVSVGRRGRPRHNFTSVVGSYLWSLTVSNRLFNGHVLATRESWTRESRFEWMSQTRGCQEETSPSDGSCVSSPPLSLHPVPVGRYWFDFWGVVGGTGCRVVDSVTSKE